MSSRTEKYRGVIEKAINKYGVCRAVAIENYAGRKNAFLFQNMFPVLPKYVDHAHEWKGNQVPVDTRVQSKLKRNFSETLRLHKLGRKVIFPDIDRLEQLMLAEIANFRVTVKSTGAMGAMGAIRATASAEYHGLVIENIKIIENRSGGYQVALPRRQKDNVWKDIVFPVERHLRQELNAAVLAAYKTKDSAPEAPDQVRPEDLAVAVHVTLNDNTDRYLDAPVLGDSLLGTANIITGRVALTGCQIVGAKNGDITVKMPCDRHGEVVSFASDGLRQKIINAVVSRYKKQCQAKGRQNLHSDTVIHREQRKDHDAIR
jgi:DNA-binding cell septation regulator SpoVG